MKKKIFTLIIGLLTALGAAAQNNGNAGPLTWNYNAGTKTLTITGEGEMPDYAYGGGTDRPWQTFKDEIETVTIGHGVTTVGNCAFTQCSKLQSITLPASLTKIGDHGFSFCTALQSIALPAALSEIGDYAFNGCTALTAFEVDPGNARYTATDGVLYDKAKTNLRKYPAGKAATSFSVPAGVTYIGEYAFNAAAKLQSITLPAGVKSIGEHAFHGCTTLQSIALPEGLTTIGKYAFFGCRALQSIAIPSTVTSIEASAFSRCTALQSIALPAALTDINGSAFFNCTALTAIGVDAGNARFTSADGVLYNKAKTELVRYPAGKPGTAFTVPAEVKKIGNEAFENCKLQSITLPAGLTTIGRKAFLSCTALQSIAIPAAVTSIEDYAFEDCTALTEVTVAWDTPLDIPPYVFHRVTLSNVTLRVPAGKMPAYQAEAVWKNFGTITDGVLFFLAVSPATLSFVAAGETKPVTVTASGAWTAASDQSWLTLSTGNGTGNTTISVTAANYTGTAPRTAKVTFTSSSITQEVNVTQQGASAPPTLAVSPATLSFVAAGETKPVTVTASGAWTAASDQSWLTLSTGSGTGNTTVNVTAANYTGTTPRTAKVTFTAGSLTQEVNVTQQGASAPPTLAVSPATLSFVAAGETKPVTVTASGAWTAASDQSWLTLSTGSGTGNMTVNVTAANYTGTTPRTAKVTFTAGSLTQEVNVTQQGASAPPTLAVSPATLSFVAAGENKALTVTATHPWTARCDASWITLSTLSGTGDGTITVTAPAYADEWPRTAKIFFASGALKDTVTVTQHPKPGPKFLALDYTELTLPMGASQRLVVTAYPKDADINRGVKWYSLNDDIATVSANGTVTALKPGRTEITVVANVGGQQTTCRVRVVPAEQMVTVTSGSDNTLRIALTAPSDADFTLSFDVDLPEGFALDAKKTAPDASLADGYTVTVTGNRVEMKPGGLRAGGTIEKRDLLTLACTAVPGTSNGSYKGALRNLAFTPTAGYALQNVTVPFTLTYTVGNETVDGLRVYASGRALYLTLPNAATVHIYNVEGALVKTFALTAGDHVQPLADGMYLVRVGEQVRKILVK